MKGIVYRADRDMRVETVPDPSIVEPGDVIVKVTKASVCGSDLHIYNHGEAFGFSAGCRTGHEFVGVIEEVGPAVKAFARGDKVLSPFWISCGDCRFCQRGLFTSCVAGGCFGFQTFWPGGGEVQGAQSQYVRVPMAEGTLTKLPESLADDSNDMRTLPLTDVFATGYHACVCGGVKEGDTVLVMGDGAVGLSAVHAATLFNPTNIVITGHHDDRLEIARRMGATHTVNTTRDDPTELLKELTDGFGPSSVLAAVASSETMKYAAEIIEPGGGIGYVGMEVFLGAPEIPWDAAFMKNVTVAGGVAPVRKYLPTLLPLLEQGKIDPSPVLTHDLPMDQAADGYRIMANREEGSVKVAISPQQ